MCRIKAGPVLSHVLEVDSGPRQVLELSLTLTLTLTQGKSETTQPGSLFSSKVRELGASLLSDTFPSS